MSSGVYCIENDEVIFYVKTEGCKQVYMSAACSEYSNENYKIVFVDSMKFLSLWKSDPCKQEYHLSSGGKLDWKSDYKYHYAEEGFSQGVTNPVPLAYMHCEESDAGPFACFTNGITRTIWLLANGAKSFPIKTDRKSASLLNKYAGVGEGILDIKKAKL